MATHVTVHDMCIIRTTKSYYNVSLAIHIYDNCMEIVAIHN